jgi:hypothetical protein
MRNTTVVFTNLGEDDLDQRRAVVAFRREGEVVRVGVAICSPVDHFSRHIGHAKAVGRTLCAQPIIEPIPLYLVSGLAGPEMHAFARDLAREFYEARRVTYRGRYPACDQLDLDL